MPCNVKFALSKETVKSSCEGLQPSRAYTELTVQSKSTWSSSWSMLQSVYVKVLLISLGCINETSRVLDWATHGIPIALPNQRVEVFWTIRTTQTYRRNCNTCLRIGSMSLILLPTNVLWHAAWHVEVDATIESDPDALPPYSAEAISAMIQYAASKDLHASDELCWFCVASLCVL